MRGSAALVILPNVDVLATLAPGALKCGLLSRSKKSPRNCVEKRSEMRKVLAKDQSRLNVPGARNTLRGLEPKVPRAAGANTAGVKHALIQSARGQVEGRVGAPMKSARSSRGPGGERSG